MRLVKICGFFVLAILFAGVGLAGEKTDFVFSSFFDPYNLGGHGIAGELLHPATISCPGFEATGIPMQPCPPGSNIHWRGSVLKVRLVSSDVRVNGWCTIIANGNWDPDFTGPVWGTFSLAVDGGGIWEGTFEGQRWKEGNHWVGVDHQVGHGTQGPVEGLVMRNVETITSPTPMPALYWGETTGIILEPGKKH